MALCVSVMTRMDATMETETTSGDHQSKYFHLNYIALNFVQLVDPDFHPDNVLAVNQNYTQKNIYLFYFIQKKVSAKHLNINLDFVFLEHFTN